MTCRDEKRRALLVVVCGLPGTGKTTLSKALVQELRAVYLRVDVVETPLARAGIDVGALGYEVVRELSASNLALGGLVVVDLVNPLPVTRRVWVELAAEHGARLVVLECVVPDEVEHRRRVEVRQPDLGGHVVPTWNDVVKRDYVTWDEDRDGCREMVDMTHTLTGVRFALEAICNA